MTTSKKSAPPVIRKGGKAAALLGAAATLLQFVTPEMIERLTLWLKQMNLSQRFIDLMEKLSKLPQQATPLERIQLQCDAVEELIESRATELSDDAPITQWRDELNKIRRGIELISKASVSDRKKIKKLQQRSKKLLDSVFNAAIN
ncbi:hypothetical protein BIGA_0312 [Bifidobacterium pullorum subsp. gallinarum]|uniref:Uncharacterized protein n=1 Tax=Bifidobacterium pullorum subsp. gallinarum TaxID=78344 RepID=A0A087ASN8_9BIFI|nr:hypothetical protein [Bifidobacterium pullorum]KFI61788.1 hypothetical protein BIGA_0312 [Bifidobacterium pullorum subsp. gallinarum]